MSSEGQTHSPHHKNRRIRKGKSRGLPQDELNRRKSLQINLNYDLDLPVVSHRDTIVASIRDNSVSIVCGETGSGKSTQLPKFCWEAGLGRTGWIGHTQPRRLAARSVASRIAEELETPVGQVVGYKMRFTDRVADSTVIKLMTDGILISELQRDRLLYDYDCVIIDEAHERSINIDLTIAHLKRILAVRPEFRVVITSATIDAEKFAAYFSDDQHQANVFNVSGRTYPVEIRYRPTSDQANSLPAAIDELSMEPAGDILVFLPTERDIRFCEKQLRGHLTDTGRLNHFDLLPLFARMSEADQNRIFHPSGKKRIILATNVAESSITVPRVRYVIDSGLARISRYAARSKVQRLPIEPVSQASANQRAGRCGRVADGICIRLYSQEDYAARSVYTTPEIRRANLAHVMLQIKLSGIHDIFDLEWLEPPLPESVREAKSTLAELNAIDDDERITQLGKRLGRWPVDPRVARILISAHENHCLADCLIIAAGLEVQDPRLRPADRQNAADEAQAIFQHPASDYGSLLLLWDFYHKNKSSLSRSKLDKACQSRFLSPARFREWIDVHNQLKRLTEWQHMQIGNRKWVPESITSKDEPKPKRKSPQQASEKSAQKELVDELLKTQEYQAIHSSMLTGLLSGIAMRREDGRYSAANRLEVQIWPGSGVKQVAPRWLVATELVETSNRYARKVAAIESYWLADIARHLIKYSYESPHFSRKSGQAMIHRKAHLFGLPVLPADRVPLAPIDPGTARQLLIDEGIVAQEIKTNAHFVQENIKLLSELEEYAQRTRRKDLLLDKYQLEAFYHQRIPADVVDRNSLERWAKTLDASVDSAESPYLKWNSQTRSFDKSEVTTQFPEALNVGGAQVPLSYQFEPGAANDGITAFVPESAIAQVSEDRIGWLVPGLLRWRVLGLIKTLPKRLRRNLSPAPDAADKISKLMLDNDQGSQSFWDSLCRWSSEVSGEKITKPDFEADKLDDYLKLQIAVVDGEGNVKSTTRDVSTLRRTSPASTGQSNQLVNFNLKSQPWFATKLIDFTIDQLPDQIVIKEGDSSITRYPTIVTSGDSIETAIVDHPEAAAIELRMNTAKLLANVMRREVNSQVRHLPGFNQTKMVLGRRISAAALEQDLGLLLVDLACLEGKPIIRSRDDFQVRKIGAFERLSIAAADVGRWLPRVAENYQNIALLLEKNTPNNSAYSDIKAQLDWLFQDKFLLRHRWEMLKELPRYLAGIEHRIRKLQSGGMAADERASKIIEPFQKAFDKKLAVEHQIVAADQPLSLHRGQTLGTLAELNWMLQEFRVSLYAQQLGTVISVSAKRLEKLCEKLS